MSTEDLNKKIAQLKKEIATDKTMIVIVCMVILAVQVIYTSITLSHEQTTGEKMIQVVPLEPVTFMLYQTSHSDPEPGDAKK